MRFSAAGKTALLGIWLVLMVGCLATPATQPADAHLQVTLAEQTFTATCNTLTDLRQGGLIGDADWATCQQLRTIAFDALGKARARADAGDAFDSRFYLAAFQEALDKLRAITAQKGAK